MIKGTLYAVSFERQRAEIEAHCFGDCGAGIMGALSDDELGPMIPCRRSVCPHLAKQSEQPLWTAEGGEQVFLRRLK